ncbi:MAG: hypothetical protein AABZ06_08040, partial [Bdellovibrionota bacterium]
MKMASWLFLMVPALVSIASADQILITEVDSLRNDLPINDPSRPLLTLRLADLIFYDAPGPQQKKRAMALYEEALTGAGTTAAIPAGMQRSKIQFQIARLASDLGQTDKSKVLWLELLSQNDLPDLQREAALRLAEMAEKVGSQSTITEAKQYYTRAIELCSSGDVCSYAHYRRAWLMKNEGEIEAAISEMKMALWDSKKQVKEEALRDLVLFLSLRTDDGRESLIFIEELAAKLSRLTLLTDLAEAYYSNGNKTAGTYILDYANQKS